MPTVELQINGKWTPVEVGAGATQDDLDEIVSKHFGGSSNAPPEAAPVEAPPPDPDAGTSFLGRAGGYLLDRGERYARALGDITGFGPELGVTGPGTDIPKVAPTQAALDAALLGGTAVAPLLTGSGLLVGTLGRGAGLPKEAAEGLETAFDIMGGGVQTANAAVQGVRTAAAAPAVERAALEAQRRAQAVENVSGNIGEAGEAAAATRGAAASGGAAGISDAARTSQAVTGNLGASTAEAGQAARGAQTIERLGTETPRGAGVALRESLPGAEATERAAFQDATYNRIGKFATDNGLVASRENPVGQRLRERLQAADDEWGMLANTAEHKQVNNLMAKLKPEEPTSLVDPRGNPIASSKPGEPVTWDDLDKADKALQRVRGPSSVRAAIADAKKQLLDGTPAAKALEDANAQWRLTVRPAKELAADVRIAESPVQAFQRAAGSAKDPQRLTTSQRLLEAHDPEAWTKVVGGFYTDMVQRARGDPRKLVKIWDGVRPEVRSIVDPNGVAAKAFEDMTQTIGPRGLPNPTEIPGVTLPEPKTRFLPEMPPETPDSGTMRRYAQMGGMTAGMGYGGYQAIQHFYHGDWKAGLGALGLGTLGGFVVTHPQLAGAGLREAAPVAGRYGLAASATPSVQNLGR
jgi:hypothetical protein